MPNFLAPSLRRLSHTAVATALVTALLSAGAAPEALACGGFFCSAAQPVNQAAERIIFAKNDDDTVTQIVQVMYEGPSEKFSWVLPVVGTPEVDISSDQAFDRLQAATNPQYQLLTTFASCDSGSGRNFAAGGISNDAGFAPGGSEVIILAAGTVGPFDYEVISVQAGDTEPADVAVRWLEDHGYDLAPRTREVLGPYLEAGLNLVAFRLTKGATTGSIRPISVTYPGRRPAIPIRPTAVAANDDMGVLVWVLSEHRAVPTNYFGLELNEALVDWFNPASNYDQVVTAAANEAGGQGFVTELAGPAAIYEDVILAGGLREARAQYSPQMDPARLVLSSVQVFGGFDGFDDLLRRHVTLRDGWTPEDFIECPSCYEGGWATPGSTGAAPKLIDEEDPLAQTDAAAFLSSFDELVYLPLVRTAELFGRHAKVTRLYTTMSAEDMDLDPLFDFNPDLEDVSNLHTAEQRVGCDGEWIITLANGVRVLGEGNTWPFALGAPLASGLPANARILQLGTSGPGTVRVDTQASITAELRKNSGFPRMLQDADLKPASGSCAYSPSAPGGALWLFGLPALLGAATLRRRSAKA